MNFHMLFLIFQIKPNRIFLFLLFANSKEAFNSLAKNHVMNYWEIKLRQEAAPLDSRKYFKPEFMSLTKANPIFLSAGASPYKVIKVRFLSGRYRIEGLCRHWSNNPCGFCICPSCFDQQFLKMRSTFCSFADHSPKHAKLSASSHSASASLFLNSGTLL